MKTFYERVYENLKEESEREILIGKKEGKYFPLTFKDFKDQIRALQESLNSLRREDRVAIFMENRPEWISSFYAVLFKGGIAVPVDYLLSEEELFNVLKDSQPTFLITSNQNYKKAQKAVEKIGYHVKIINIDSDLKKVTAPLEFKEREKDEVAVILYTSGTTGNPKGVMLTLENLDHNVRAVESLGFLRETDRFIAILPFHHTYPLMATVLLPITLKIPLVFIEKLTPNDILETMNEQKITIMIGVPKLYHVIHHNIMAQINKLPKVKREAILGALRLFRRAGLKPVQRKLFSKVHEKVGKSLRFMISGGAKLSEEVWKDFEAMGFNVLEGYGLTETSPLISVNRPNKKRIGSAGIPVDEVEVKISENGEIVVKGPNIMKGYYNKPEETAKVIKDGWFYTGDLGYIDKDGFLHITGRAKEVIVLDSGKNVYPEDIELEILKSPYILEVGVFYDEGKLKALIRPDFELLLEERIEEVREFIKRELHRTTKHLQPYKKVKEFKVIDRELPRTRIGKLRRFLLPQVWRET